MRKFVFKNQSGEYFSDFHKSDDSKMFANTSYDVSSVVMLDIATEALTWLKMLKKFGYWEMVLVNVKDDGDFDEIITWKNTDEL